MSARSRSTTRAGVVPVCARNARLDLAAIGVAKNAADPAGHYSRPDVVRLLFNNKPAKRVEHFSLPHDVLAPD
jgi:nitrilase